MDKLIYIIALLIFIYIIKKDYIEKENFENTTISVTAPDDLNSINVLSQLAAKLIENNSLTFPGSIQFNGSVLTKGSLNVQGNINASGSITATNANFTNFNLIPKGLITIWCPMTAGGNISASLASIPPPGWAICDGTRGTPDLRGKFIYGADNRNPNNVAGNTGGSETIKLAVENLPPHKHLSILSDQYNYAGTCNQSCSTGNTIIGTGGTALTTGDGSDPGESGLKGAPINIMPPYICLFYIMKL